MTREYMLDTNIFNLLAKDGTISVDVFKQITLFATHIQIDELNKTSNHHLKSLLVQMFDKVNPENIPTSAAVWGVSKWGGARWGDADGLYERLKERVQKLDKANGKKPRNPTNQTNDALIAVTAIKNNLTLITTDLGLKQSTIECGGKAIHFDEFLKLE